MLKRIIAIAFIFACATVAWMILGGTIFARTQRSDSTLRGRVASTWGAPQEQAAPAATVLHVRRREVTAEENGKTVVRMVDESVPIALPLEKTHARGNIALEHRR